MKKVILTESDKKQIISEKERMIIENFAKNFNKIKRIDDNEVNADLIKEVKFEDNSISNTKSVKKIINEGMFPEQVWNKELPPPPQGNKWDMILAYLANSYNNQNITANDMILTIGSIAKGETSVGAYQNWMNHKREQQKQGQQQGEPQQGQQQGQQPMEEDWKTNVAAGLATAAGGMGAQAQQHHPDKQNQPQQTAQSNDLKSIVAKGGPELAERLVNAFQKNPKAAWQWQKQHKQTSLVDNIAIGARNKDLRADLGNMYNGSGSTPLELVVSFLQTVEGNAYHF